MRLMAIPSAMSTPLHRLVRTGGTNCKRQVKTSGSRAAYRSRTCFLALVACTGTFFACGSGEGRSTKNHPGGQPAVVLATQRICHQTVSANGVISYDGPESWRPATEALFDRRLRMRRLGRVSLFSPPDAGYYRDAEVGGGDVDSTYGIDTADLLYYVGHGRPQEFQVQQNKSYTALRSVKLGNMVSSDEHKNGHAKYAWFCSCRLFAHGPGEYLGGRSGEQDYPHPEHFDDTYSRRGEMENAIESWRRTFGSGLRMACGASTSIICDENVSRSVALNYSSLELDPADAVLLGLRSSPKHVSLCIAPSKDQTPDSSALFDECLVADKRVGMDDVFHIEYTVNFSEENSKRFPKILPASVILPTIVTQLPVASYDLNFLKITEVSTEYRCDMSPSETLSPALYYLCRERRQGKSSTEVPREAQAISAAKVFLKAVGWAKERDLTSYNGAILRIDSYRPPANDKGHYVLVGTSYKGVAVEFERPCVFDSLPIKALRTGRILVVINLEYQVVAAYRECPDFQLSPDIGIGTKFHSYKSAKGEAFKTLQAVIGHVGNAEKLYWINRQTWVLKKMESSQDGGTGLRPVYIFEVTPTRLEPGVAPMRIEVDAAIRSLG